MTARSKAAALAFACSDFLRSFIDVRMEVLAHPDAIVELVAPVSAVPLFSTVMPATTTVTWALASGHRVELIADSKIRPESALIRGLTRTGEVWTYAFNWDSGGTLLGPISGNHSLEWHIQQRDLETKRRHADERNERKLPEYSREMSTEQFSQLMRARRTGEPAPKATGIARFTVVSAGVWTGDSHAAHAPPHRPPEVPWRPTPMLLTTQQKDDLVAVLAGKSESGASSDDRARGDDHSDGEPEDG